MTDQTTRIIIVGAPVDEVFEAWSEFENFPRFMKNVKAVTRTGDGRTHWAMEGPLGKKVEWDALTTTFEKNKRIAWRSAEDSPLTTSGMVTFTELGNGQTQVSCLMQWDVPASKGGDWLAELIAHPDKRLEEDLFSFKTYVEGRRVRA